MVVGTPETTKFPDRNTKDGSTVVSYAYSGEAPVVLWKVEGGGHGPPTRAWRPWVSLEGTNRDINSFREAFAFLHNFARRETGEIVEVAP
jgi:poly(3-hydroxybutyrate) depolymerase